jgi:hypothetical protein
MVASPKKVTGSRLQFPAAIGSILEDTATCEALINSATPEEAVRILQTNQQGGVRKVRPSVCWKTCSGTFIITVFSHRFNETGENTRAVQKVTRQRSCRNFLDSPLLF